MTKLREIFTQLLRQVDRTVLASGTTNGDGQVATIIFSSMGSQYSKNFWICCLSSITSL